MKGLILVNAEVGFGMKYLHTESLMEVLDP